MPKISIIIPVYNSQEFLRRCLDSAIHQTLRDIEIIIIDDASCDKSRDVIIEYTKKDLRIKTRFFKENQGVAVARNIGITMATGEFIGFIDSDDFVNLSYFEELYSYTEDIDIVRGIRVISPMDRQGKNKYGCIIPSIIRREFLLMKNVWFPTNKRKGEDSTFKKWLYNQAPRIFEVPDKGIYYHYIKRENSLSNYTFTNI